VVCSIDLSFCVTQKEATEI